RRATRGPPARRCPRPCIMLPPSPSTTVCSCSAGTRAVVCAGSRSTACGNGTTHATRGSRGHRCRRRVGRWRRRGATGAFTRSAGGAHREPLNAEEICDPAVNVWKAANAMPTARDHLAAVAFRGRVWALGGRSSFMGTQYANVEVYDPAADAWRTGQPLPRGRGGLAAAALPDRILVFGGEAPFRIFEATEMYEPTGDRWIAL